MKRYAIRHGEHLAIGLDSIQRDAAGFFIMCGDGAPDNDRVGDVEIVHVRGPLMHWDDGGGDSYEAIDGRVEAALAGRREGAEDAAPKAVVMRIDSPGGLVAGFTACVEKLRARAKAAGVDLIAYVDETAASGGYGLACACSQIVGPAAMLVGSVGVISTIGSQAERNALDGIDVRLVTSGSRKADGNPHAPITDGALAAEQTRVDDLAAQFFALVGTARHMTPAKVAALQAGVFLGKKAVKAGLSDAVMAFDDLVVALNARPAKAAKTEKVAQPLDKSAQPGPHVMAHASNPERAMSVKLESKILKLEAEIAGATGPAASALRSRLVILQAAKAEMDDDDGDDDGDDGDKGDDDDGEESKAE